MERTITWLATLGGVLLAARAHAEERFIPQKYLSLPGVRYLATVVHPNKNPKGIVALRDAFRDEGLYTVQLYVIEGARCPDPAWKANDFLCNDGTAVRTLSVYGAQAQIYLWAWDGRLLVSGGDAKAAQSAIRKDLARAPQVMVDSRSRRVTNGMLERALAKTKKFSRAPSSVSETLRGRIKNERFSSYYLRAPKCKKKRLRRGDLVLGARDKNGVQLVLRTLSGCGLAKTTVRYRAHDDEANLARGILALSVLLSKTPVYPDTPPPEAYRPLVVRPDQVATHRDGSPETTFRISRELLTRISGAEGLVSFVRGWIGVPHSNEGNSRSGINAANFVRRAMQAAYGHDPGQDIFEQLQTNPEVLIRESNPAAPLRPGDLVFYVSYSYRPRHVMVYLGDGYVAHAARVRGVVVEEIPKDPPNYLHLVARRPLMRE